MSEIVKCVKCGFENSSNVKFCGNCGARLSVTLTTPRFEGLALLHLTGSIYLLISVIFNAVVQTNMIFVISYVASGLLGLYAGYELYKGKVGRPLKIISALSIVIGLASTLILFLIGLTIIGPIWILFAASAFLSWKNRKRP